MVLPRNRLDIEIVLISLDTDGKVCSCAFVFNFVSAKLDGITTECWAWQ